jgi:hypothetical protein
MHGQLGFIHRKHQLKIIKIKIDLLENNLGAK